MAKKKTSSPRQETIDQDDLSNLPLKALQSRCEENDLPTSGSKADLVERLTEFQLGKYVVPMTQVKKGDGWDVGISLNDHKHLVEMGKKVERKEARSTYYSSGQVHFDTSEKML